MSRGPETFSDGIPRLGGTLGRYRLDAVIGRGGMGVVFRAVDGAMDRTVAIKVLAPDLASDPQVRARFLREGRLAAAIEHPHIVPVYEAASADGIDYIAMRFIPGSDLSRILHREAPLDLARTLAICEQLADALDAAHAQGLVHRDVKPGNVLLEGVAEDWVWLTDFGLTKRLGGSVALTRDGLIGTLEYMAPEAIAHGVVDGRSDQYALACLTYHCLAGASPFEHDSEARVLHGHLHERPPPITERVAGVPSGVDRVIRQALAKDPRERFASCRAYATALRRAADQATTKGRVTTGSSTRAGPTIDDAPSSRHQPTRIPRLVPVTLARRRYLVGAVVLAGAIGGSMHLVGGSGRGSGELGSGPTDAPLAAASLGSLPVGSPAVASPAGLTGPDGVIVYAGGRSGNYDIWAVRPDGTGLIPITDDPRPERAPSVSKDGSRVVFTLGPTGKRDIYMVNGDGSGRTRLTSDPGDDYAPAISPDGRMIAWASDRAGFTNILLMTERDEGFDEDRAKVVTDQPSADGNHSREPAWFPDARQIAFQSNDEESSDIWSVAVDDDARRRPWTQDLLGDYQPTVGQDGTVIVFVRQSDATGDRSLYRVTADDDRPRLLADGLRHPANPDFSPDFRQLVVATDEGLLTMSSNGTRQRDVPIDMPTTVEPVWVGSVGTP